MGTDSQIDFLKDALTYLENRINLVDNKATALMLIQGGLFALYEWSHRLPGIGFIQMTFIPSDFEQYLDLPIFVLTGLTLIFLIQIIRPAKYIYNWRAKLDQFDETDHLLWFSNDFPNTPNDYRDKVNELRKIGKSEILRNYEK